jgi:hypothetical protein
LHRWAGDSPNNNRRCLFGDYTGGWNRCDGDTGHFGVTLNLAYPNQL